jgi:hypothetical protein
MGFFGVVRTVIACFLLLIAAFFTVPLIWRTIDDADMFVLLGLPPGVIGVAMLRSVRRERKRLAQEDADAREVALLRLADAEGGTLTATQVASRLSWQMGSALDALRAVEDAGPVQSTMTDEGVLVFEFREIIHDPARKPASLPPEPAAASSVTEAAEPAG